MESTQLKFLYTDPVDPIPVYYYFLLTPSEPIFSRVLSMKKLADSFLRTNFNSHFKPHITLLQFRMDENKEKQLVELIENNLPDMKALFMKSNGLKIYASSRVICVSLSDQAETLRFNDDIHRILFINGLIPTKKRDFFKATDLHITIVKNVNSKDANEVLEILSPQFSNSGFSCNNLVLLKSNTGNAPWKHIKTFFIP